MKFFYVLFLFFLLCCVETNEPVSKADLQKEFEREFGFPPPNSLEIKSKNLWIYDGWCCWMRFTYDDSVYKKICRLTHFNAPFSNDNPLSDFSEKNVTIPEWRKKLDSINTNNAEIYDSLSCSKNLIEDNVNAPEWWIKPDTTKVKIHYGVGFNKSFWQSGTILWVDENKKHIYLLDSGHN